MSERTTSPKLGSRFEEALGYAARAHAFQVRKTSPAPAPAPDGSATPADAASAAEIPYVAHLLAVASLVIEHGGDEDAAIAALLHDAIEDQGGSVRREDIRLRFGDEVVRIVDACSDNEGEPKPPWRERKLAYIAHLAAIDDPQVRLVTACDKLHNARAVRDDHRALGSALWARFNGGRDGTLWYYRAVADEIVRGGPRSIGAEIARVVDELEAEVAAREPDWRKDELPAR